MCIDSSSNDTQQKSHRFTKNQTNPRSEMIPLPSLPTKKGHTHTHTTTFKLIHIN